MKYIVYALFIASFLSGSMVAFTEIMSQNQNNSPVSLENSFTDFSNTTLQNQVSFKD